MNSELQYLNDTVLIEKLAEEQLKFYYRPLYKQAGVLDTLGGVAESIKNTVKQQFEEGGVTGGIANIMAPSILFKLHPLAGILYLIGTTFGFDITSIFSKIMQMLKPKLESGNLTLDEVNEVGKSVVAQEAGSIDATASNNMLSYLYKNSQYYSKYNTQELPKIPWLLPDQNAGPIQKIFGELLETRRAGKAKWLLGGFIVWIIKTMLMGAGLLAGASAISNLIRSKQTTESGTKSEIKPSIEVSDSENHENKSEPVVENKFILKPSGKGQQTFANDSGNLWIVPLINQNVEDTLWAWAIDVYPDLYNYQSESINSSAFERVAGMLKANWKNSSPSKLVMPAGLTSRKQVVDLFVREIVNMINKKEI